MIRLLRGEEFKEIELNDELKIKYAISNHGRVVSYTDDILLGRELKGSLTGGFRVFNYSKYTDGKRKCVTLQLSRLVAKYFLPKPLTEDHKFVIHLDFDKLNDKVENLKWSNQREVIEHNKKNPLVIEGHKKTLEKKIIGDGRKLTSTQVIRIKKMLQREDNKTRLVLIAKQFNITTQQLYRIRTGENWGHIKV